MSPRGGAIGSCFFIYRDCLCSLSLLGALLRSFIFVIPMTLDPSLHPLSLVLPSSCVLVVPGPGFDCVPGFDCPRCRSTGYRLCPLAVGNSLKLMFHFI